MPKSKMNLNATWSMAVGGMIGGGIFSVLGVIISFAGQWAWLSFLLAGIISLIAAHSYSELSIKYKEGGGAFTFLRKINREGFSGSLSWILIMGYILTLSVYAFTFGHYVAHVFNTGTWLSKVLAVAIILFLSWINLRGVGNASRLEIVTVYGKLIVLIALALFGLIAWSPEALNEGISPKPWHAAIVGAATIFMAYEGFQLLSYDYEDLRDPDRTLPKATIWAVLSVIIIYIMVTLGTTMLVGAKTLIEQKEIALAVAGQKILGNTGLIIVTIAAAFSTASAINATLFSTARLMENVAQKKDLPHLFVKENQQNIPYYAIIMIGSLAAILSVTGSLNSLVDAASLIFLFTFGVVNVIAYREKVKYHWLCLTGAILSGLAIIADLYVQLLNRPVPLLLLTLLVVLTFVLRPYLLKKFNSEDN